MSPAERRKPRGLGGAPGAVRLTTTNERGAPVERSTHPEKRKMTLQSVVAAARRAALRYPTRDASPRSRRS